MKFFYSAAIAAIAASSVNALNILLSNDDGFASAQLVETFRLLKAKGHSVVAVASGLFTTLYLSPSHVTYILQRTTKVVKVAEQSSQPKRT